MATQSERTAATTAALLDAGARLFAARGFHGASLDDVAHEAGVSKGAVYHHYAGKQAFFLALAQDRLNRRVRQAPDAAKVIDEGGDVAAALPFDRDWALLFLEFVVHGARHPPFGAALRELVFQARAAMGGGDESPDRRRFVEAFAAASNGVSIEALLDGEERRAALLLGHLAERLR